MKKKGCWTCFLSQVSSEDESHMKNEKKQVAGPVPLVKYHQKNEEKRVARSVPKSNSTQYL